MSNPLYLLSPTLGTWGSLRPVPITRFTSFGLFSSRGLVGCCGTQLADAFIHCHERFMSWKGRGYSRVALSSVVARRGLVGWLGLATFGGYWVAGCETEWTALGEKEYTDQRLRVGSLQDHMIFSRHGGQSRSFFLFFFMGQRPHSGHDKKKQHFELFAGLGEGYTPAGRERCGRLF